LWTIPAERMKMRKKRREPHCVPLSRQAIALLDALRECRVGDFVFFGQDPRHPVSRAIVSKHCDRVTGGKGSVHGWRATFRSWAADHGVPRETAESTLAHALGGVEAAYNRASLIGVRRPVMQRWADWLDGKDNVVAFERRAAAKGKRR